MAITIKDIAREAGVSISTVSKVINGSHTISQATIDNVRGIMERLEYAPNQRAANFARASTKIVAYLIPLQKGMAYETPHYYEMVSGAQSELCKNGYSLSLVDTSHEEKKGDTVKKIIMQKSADGIIIATFYVNRSIADFIVEKKFPHVFIGKPDYKHSLSWIDIDNVISGEIAARHLIECGYLRVAFIGGNEESFISSYRVKGVKSTLEQHGLALIDDYLCYINQDVNESYDAMVSLLHKNPRPDAVVCDNSLVAVGVSNALKDNNIKVPNDMGLIMIDDNPYSKVISPMPTVVNIDVYDFGAQIAKSVLRKIKNPDLQVQTYSTLPELITRGTTQRKGG